MNRISPTTTNNKIRYFNIPKRKNTPKSIKNIPIALIIKLREFASFCFFNLLISSSFKGRKGRVELPFCGPQPHVITVRPQPPYVYLKQERYKNIRTAIKIKNSIDDGGNPKF